MLIVELAEVAWGEFSAGDPVSVVDLVGPAKLREKHGFGPVPERSAVQSHGRVGLLCVRRVVWTVL